MIWVGLDYSSHIAWDWANDLVPGVPALADSFSVEARYEWRHSCKLQATNELRAGQTPHE
jgi:hypothetical protein